MNSTTKERKLCVVTYLVPNTTSNMSLNIEVAYHVMEHRGNCVTFWLDDEIVYLINNNSLVSIKKL